MMGVTHFRHAMWLLIGYVVLFNNIFAQWSSDPATNTPVNTATGDAFEPTIVSDGAGGTIIIWQDNRFGFWDIYSQKLNTTGEAQWATNGIPVCTATGNQQYPQAISDGNGGVIVVWSDYRNGKTWAFAQRIDADGTQLWQTDGLAIADTTFEHFHPRLISDGAGGAIIAWDDGVDIYTQRVSAVGALHWGNSGAAICTASYGQASPNIVGDGLGGAIIAWEDRRATLYNIYAQRVNANGSILWQVDGIEVRSGSEPAWSPRLETDGANGAILVWSDDRNIYPNRDIFVQRVDLNGNVKWTVNGVAVCNASGYQSNPVLTSDQSGGVIVGWDDQRSGNVDVYTQRITDIGSTSWSSNGISIAGGTPDQALGGFSSDSSGGVVAAWTENNIIKAQRIDPSGNKIWESAGVTVSNAIGARGWPELVYPGGTGIVISWLDARNISQSAWDIYAQQVTLAGQLPLFTDIAAALPPIQNSSTAWGDYDNDGDLDILLTGFDDTGTYISKIYRNDGDILTDIGATITGVEYSSVAWGDYDNDGDLDIMLTGRDNTDSHTSIVYRNDAGNFVDVGAGLAGVHVSAGAWGDYDNDGDLDILLTGRFDPSTYISKVYRNDGGSFADINAGITGVDNSSVVWGDYDSDGDLDILLTGYYYDGSVHFISKVYRNDGGSFIDISASLTGVYSGSAAWGDYDSDGDLDILLTGWDGSNDTSMVYRNDGGSFTDIITGLTGVSGSSAAWGDYDNDGDLDILLTGAKGLNPIFKIYRNDGGSFVDVNSDLPGAYNGSADWGDYDNDGDLDILLTGEDNYHPRVTRIYRNNIGTSNTTPAAPPSLTSVVDADSVTLSWGAASDNETPTLGLTYNLHIGTTPGGGEIMSPHAAAATGYRLIPALGNVNHVTSWTIGGFPEETYYWSVQAVDAGYMGSAFATEQTFTIATPPTAPTSLSAAPGDQQITLIWDANSETDLADYYLYRYTANDSLLAARIDTIPKADTSATDAGLANGTPYWYWVSAVDSASNESVYSIGVTATPVNYPPAITSLDTASATEDVYFSYQALATDPEDSTIVFTIDQRPTWLDAAADSAFGTPLEGAVDTSFRVIASDGNLTDTLMVAVSIGAVNDPPVITSSAIANATEDVYFKYVAQATDPEDSTVTFAFDQLPSWLFANVDSAFGTPLEGAVDTSFRVIASDGTLTDTLLVAVTIGAVNDPPVITSAATTTATEDIYFKYVVTATDPEDSTVIFTFNQLPSWLSAQADSAYGTPTQGTVDTSFQVTASDGVLIDTMIVAVTVLGISLSQSDSLALVALYNSTDGANWTTTWNLNTPVSTWYGVTVAGGRVTELDLNSNNLSGNIPAELGNLANLTDLNLYFNQLSGSIPAALGNLTNLTLLQLSFNQLSGSIPVELGNLSNLTTLWLSNNQLSGSIPAELGNLANLLNFLLHENQFSGLPVLSTLTALDDLRVENNRLTFEDIEPNIGVASSSFTYAPQDSVGNEIDTTVIVGSSLDLGVFVGGTSNIYQWTKDGFDIPGATSDPLTLSNIQISANGDYTLRTTNTIATDLTLFSRPIHVFVTGTATRIISTSPSQNALNVPLDTSITVTFGVDMNPSTINDTTFVVHGGYTGKLSGAYSYNEPSKTATFTPAGPFKVGEQVNVTLTAGAQTLVGDYLPNAFGWDFTAEVLGGSGVFATAVNYSVGSSPYSVTSADLDGDGDLDLAVANNNSNTVSVLPGNGDGTFAAKTDYATGSAPFSVFVADLDGDGDIDLAVANFNSNTVSVLLNNGNSTFAAKTDYTTGSSPLSVFAADLDGDGDLDLAVANEMSGTVSVLPGNGDGTFAAKTDYATGNNPHSVIAADLDGDGDIDLAVVNNVSNTVSVLLGNGDGTFAAKTGYGTGSGPQSVFAADLDGDGDIDLATANFWSDNVSVLLNINAFSARVTLDTYAEYTDTFGIPYRISNPDSNLTSLICDYSPDDGVTWQSATIIGDTSDISPGQYQDTLQWDSYADLPGQDLTTIQFRITPYDQTGEGRSYTTASFHLDNNREPLAVTGSIAGEQAGDVTISYTLSDAEGDTLSYTAEYSTDQGNIWQNATVTGISSNLDSTKYSGQLTWRTLDDLPGYEDLLTYFRIVPSDNDPGTAGEVVFHLDNNEPPSLTLSQLPDNTIISQVTIPFVLTDPESDTLAITTEVSFDQGQSWMPSGVGTEYSAIAPADYTGEFSWLAFASVYGERQNVQVRAIPYDYDPGPGDTLTGLTVIYHIGDYTGDLIINNVDLAQFASAWNATPQNTAYEVGPANGTVPNITPQPDGVLDFEDLTVFAMMWNWSFANNGFTKSIPPLAKAASGATSLTLVQRIPDNLWAEGATDLLTIDVYVNRDDPMMMVDGVLSFDPLMVKYVGIEKGGYLQQYYESTPMFTQVSPDSSQVLFAVVGLGKQGEIKETDLPVATIQFKPVTKTTQDLRLNYALRDESGDKVEQNLAFVELESLLPEQFVLHQNFPNPFNPNTSLRYELPIATDVVLVVYDILGREVIRLVSDHQEAGYHQVIWQGQDKFGRGLASGVYIYRLATPNYSRSRKMLLLK